MLGEGEEPGKLPLLALHGGPGGSHLVLAEGLAPLARRGRRVILYDQLGSGESSRPSDPSLWRVETFLEQLQSVRDGLGLERIHLLGSSWGGMLALEYVFTRPPGLVGLVLNSTPTSAPRWALEAQRLVADLPAGLHARAAEKEFKRRHVCRLDPQPAVLAAALAVSNGEVYETMWGPTEFAVTGTLRDWDVIDRLGEVELPTLITSGRHDECTPALVEPLHAGIAGSDWALFEGSSHMPYLEEPERFLRIVGEFLDGVEAQTNA